VGALEHRDGPSPKPSRYIIDGSNADDAEWPVEFGLGRVLDGVAVGPAS
jgi:hypothetical protein